MSLIIINVKLLSNFLEADFLTSNIRVKVLIKKNLKNKC